MKKPITHLIALLLLLQPILSGCAAAGYAIGEEKDIREAKPEPLSSLDGLKKEDILVVEVCDGGLYPGTLVEMRKGQSLTIRISRRLRPPLTDPDVLRPIRRGGEYEIPWADLVVVSVIHAENRHRLGMMATGFLVDVAVISFFVVLKLVGGAYESMG